jgi:Fungal protein kinase
VLHHWSTSVLAVEVNPTDLSEDEVDIDTIFQQAMYMSHVLREQHDRRFVFGIVIFHTKLTLWFCDRSGLLGTYDTIDIQTVCPYRRGDMKWRSSLTSTSRTQMISLRLWPFLQSCLPLSMVGTSP